MTGPKPDDTLHTDYVPTVFAFVPVAGASRKRKSIDWYERSQKHARNQNKKNKEKTLPTRMKEHFCRCRDEHSVPDCVEKI